MNSNIKAKAMVDPNTVHMKCEIPNKISNDDVDEMDSLLSRIK